MPAIVFIISCSCEDSTALHVGVYDGVAIDMVVKMVARCTLASLMWLPLSPSFWQEGSV
jgi:hypothetical protein